MALHCTIRRWTEWEGERKGVEIMYAQQRRADWRRRTDQHANSTNTAAATNKHHRSARCGDLSSLFGACTAHARKRHADPHEQQNDANSYDSAWCQAPPPHTAQLFGLFGLVLCNVHCFYCHLSYTRNQILRTRLFCTKQPCILGWKGGNPSKYCMQVMLTKLALESAVWSGLVRCGAGEEQGRRRERRQEVSLSLEASAVKHTLPLLITKQCRPAGHGGKWWELCITGGQQE